ncbi:MAG: SH3 domain-containing protein, partial [Chloroflexi bacterium]|nr:SH3 domain-containing protein [Chloroflexota bacterium]
GVQVVVQATTDGSLPQATAVAWSPGGDWLAYTLRTPGAETGPGDSHPVDGLWLRGRDGQTNRLAASVYPGDGTSAGRIFTGPVDWHPDGTELLAGHGIDATRSEIAYSRVNIVSWQATPIWNTTTLLPSAYQFAQWSVNGNSIITSGAGQVLRIEPDTLGVLQTFVAPDAGWWPERAQQFGNGAVTFLNSPANADRTGPTDGPRQLYLQRADQIAPQPVSDSLTTFGRVDFVWDNIGTQTLLVVYEPPDAPVGVPYLRNAQNTLFDLTPLLGTVGAPRWGPLFRPGDTARITTVQGDPLNLRATPNGDRITGLANGTQVTIIGGPRQAGGYRWWQIRTANGVAGWSVESVEGADGLRLRTLLPVE